MLILILLLLLLLIIKLMMMTNNKIILTIIQKLMGATTNPDFKVIKCFFSKQKYRSTLRNLCINLFDLTISRVFSCYDIEFL